MSTRIPFIDPALVPLWFRLEYAETRCRLYMS
jgi:hypothetical protein